MPEPVLEAIATYGRAGYILANNEDREVARLCEISKQYLTDQALALVKQAVGKPVLYEYVGDGTPMRLLYFYSAALSEHHQVHRAGKSTTELYCQAAMIRTTDDVGLPEIRPVLRDPRPMQGKSGLHAFTACREYFPLLHQAGHVGCSLQHYSWDRALFSCCRRFALQYKESWHDLMFGPMHCIVSVSCLP